MTNKEIQELEDNAHKPDYGSKHYKPDVILELIGEIRRLKPEIKTMEVERFLGLEFTTTERGQRKTS